MYPNPAKEELNISFRSNEIREDYSVMVYSAVGQVIHQQAIVASKGSNAVKLNTSVFTFQGCISLQLVPGAIIRS